MNITTPASVLKGIYEFNVAVKSQPNPVSGTKYVLLDTTENVRIYGVFARVEWTVQPSPLEVHFTLDGETPTVSQTNPVSLTPYFVKKSLTVASPRFSFDATDYSQWTAFLTEAESVKIEIESTGGTVQNLYGYAVYGVRQ